MANVVADIVYDVADPPVVSEVRFDDLLSSATISFDTSTDLAGLSGSFSCETVLDQSAAEITALFGSGATCSFKSNSALKVGACAFKVFAVLHGFRKNALSVIVCFVNNDSLFFVCVCVCLLFLLKVAFGSGATVVPNDLVSLRSLVIGSVHPTASLKTVSAGASTILMPISPTIPAAALTPNTYSVGICDSLVLDGGGTTGAGGRKLRYVFSVTSAAGDDVRNITAVLDGVNALNGGTGANSVTVPSEALVLGTTFEVSQPLLV